MIRIRIDKYRKKIVAKDNCSMYGYVRGVAMLAITPGCNETTPEKNEEVAFLVFLSYYISAFVHL